jgi:hypothetical protein
VGELKARLATITGVPAEQQVITNQCTGVAVRWVDYTAPDGRTLKFGTHAPYRVDAKDEDALWDKPYLARFQHVQHPCVLKMTPRSGGAPAERIVPGG